MLYLKDKITAINNVLKTDGFFDSRFFNGLFENEVAEITAMQGVDKVQYMPVVYCNKEYKYIGLNDNYPIIVYHKHLGSTFTDADLDIRRVVDRMQMVVFADLDFLNLDSEAIGTIVVASFPQQTTLPIINIEGVELTDVTSDKEAIFKKEYQNTDYQLGPQHCMLSFNYTITSTYRKGCFKICLTN